MATTVAEYKFENSDSYGSAVQRLRNELGNNGDTWECEWPYIWVYDTSNYPDYVGKVCQGYGGTPI